MFRTIYREKDAARASLNRRDQIEFIVKSRHRWQRIAREQLKSRLAAGRQMADEFDRKVEAANGAREAVATQYAALMTWRHALQNERRHRARGRPKGLDLPDAERPVPENRTRPFENPLNAIDCRGPHINRHVEWRNSVLEFEPPFRRIACSPTLFILAEFIDLYRDEVFREDDLDLFFRLLQEIFDQRQERPINRRRADLPPFCFEESERERAAYEQAIEPGQQVLKDGQLFFEARAGDEADKRRIGLIDRRLEHHQLAGQRQPRRRRPYAPGDADSRGQGEVCERE